MRILIVRKHAFLALKIWGFPRISRNTKSGGNCKNSEFERGRKRRREKWFYAPSEVFSKTARLREPRWRRSRVRFDALSSRCRVAPAVCHWLNGPALNFLFVMLIVLDGGCSRGEAAGEGGTMGTDFGGVSARRMPYRDNGFLSTTTPAWQAGERHASPSRTTCRCKKKPPNVPCDLYCCTAFSAEAGTGSPRRKGTTAPVAASHRLTCQLQVGTHSIDTFVAERPVGERVLQRVVDTVNAVQLVSEVKKEIVGERAEHKILIVSGLEEEVDVTVRGEHSSLLLLSPSVLLYSSRHFYPTQITTVTFKQWRWPRSLTHFGPPRGRQRYRSMILYSLKVMDEKAMS